jgi:nucleoid DNA-binding protein
VFRQELIKEVKERTGVTQDQATELVKAVFDCMFRWLASGQSFKVNGFGAFKLLRCSALKRRAIRTGRVFYTAPKWRVKFDACYALRKALVIREPDQANQANQAPHAARPQAD